MGKVFSNLYVKVIGLGVNFRQESRVWPKGNGAPAIAQQT